MSRRGSHSECFGFNEAHRHNIIRSVWKGKRILRGLFKVRRGNNYKIYVIPANFLSTLYFMRQILIVEAHSYTFKGNAIEHHVTSVIIFIERHPRGA